MPALELTPPMFALFSAMIESACGLHYAPTERELLESKLGAHAADLGYESLLDYYYRLRYDDPGGTELARLVEALVVHETYFFRELPPLVTAIDTHVVAAVRARGSARIWSAAASSGEEPYTVAMLLAERDLLGRVELIATDVSAPAIARARANRYGRRSLRDGYPADLARKYLDVTPGGISVVPAARDAVRLMRLNLLDAEGVRALGRFDLILCRNVLIYFREDRIGDVIGRLCERLLPDGLLVIGVSESLLRFGTMFSCEERGGSFFYRRPSP